MSRRVELVIKELRDPTGDLRVVIYLAARQIENSTALSLSLFQRVYFGGRSTHYLEEGEEANGYYYYYYYYYLFFLNEFVMIGCFFEIVIQVFFFGMRHTYHSQISRET